jgi:hypothetical protein
MCPCIKDCPEVSRLLAYEGKLGSECHLGLYGSRLLAIVLL